SARPLASVRNTDRILGCRATDEGPGSPCLPLIRKLASVTTDPAADAPDALDESRDDSRDESPTGFDDLGIDERGRRALIDAGYEARSPIRGAASPPLMEGRHLVGLAQTGTGKTAAFAVPILSRIDLTQRAPQALVLAPTRELALQVAEAFGRYSHHIDG